MNMMKTKKIRPNQEEKLGRPLKILCVFKRISKTEFIRLLYTCFMINFIFILITYGGHHVVGPLLMVSVLFQPDPITNNGLSWVLLLCCHSISWVCLEEDA
jgi:hypothetical protein